MSYYYRLRGWLEIPYEYFNVMSLHVAQMREQAHQGDRSYLTGWHPAYTVHNTTAYLFYGADVQRKELDLVILDLNSILDMEYWSDDSPLDGYFNAQGEDDDDNYVIKIIANKMSIEETTVPLLDYSSGLNPAEH